MKIMLKEKDGWLMAERKKKNIHLKSSSFLMTGQFWGIEEAFQGYQDILSTVLNFPTVLLSIYSIKARIVSILISKASLHKSGGNINITN